MRYDQQLTKHDPDNGQFGDCLRTCIACICDLDPRDVPNFGAIGGDTVEEINTYLATIGKVGLFMHVAGDRERFLQYMAAINDGILYVLMGDSHAVVACGGKIIHDPSWTQHGVQNPTHILFILDRSMYLIA